MENSRKIFITMHTGYAGMTAHEAWIVPVDLSDVELCKLADERAVDHAETYGIYRVSDDEEDDSNYPGDNIEGSWKEYNEKEHAPYVTISYKPP